MVSAAEERIDESPEIRGVGFGLMVSEGRESSINYTLYEVSQQNLGILSNENLEIGQKVIIEHREHIHIPLVVHQIVLNAYLPPGYKRFRLISLDQSLNFERLLPESNQRKIGISTRFQCQVRFARFLTDVPLTVDARTFGSVRNYLTKTINVSKSGFLLGTPQGFNVPFHETTLLELTVHLDNRQQVRCLGKVIRYEVDFENKRKRYGINICEISPEDWAVYESFVDDLEHSKNRQVYRQLRLTMPF